MADFKLQNNSRVVKIRLASGKFTFGSIGPDGHYTLGGNPAQRVQLLRNFPYLPAAPNMVLNEDIFEIEPEDLTVIALSGGQKA